MGGKKKKKHAKHEEKHEAEEHTSKSKETPARPPAKAEEEPVLPPLDEVPRYYPTGLPSIQLLEILGEKIHTVPLSVEECEDLLEYLEAKEESKKLKRRVDAIKKRFTKVISTKFGGKPVQPFLNDGVFLPSGLDPSPQVTKLVKPLLKQTSKTFKNNAAYQNMDVLACVFGRQRALNCNNADQIIQVFKFAGQLKPYLKAVIEFCSSEENQSADEPHQLEFALREGSDIAPSQLFRGFVYNHQLTGICQHFHTVHFQEHTAEYLGQIAEACSRLWAANVHPKISASLDSYIFDFAIVDTKLHVVDFCPFQRAANPLLFSWTRDMRQLQQGPCQIRYRKTPLQKPYLTLREEWQTWVCQYRKVPLPSSEPEEDKMYQYFRWFAMSLVVMMTLVSVYMYLTAPPSSGGSGAMRRRRGRNGL